jgi:hypothetical protein
MCRYGVIPIENSTAGSVKKVYDLMISRNFKIVRTVRIKPLHTPKQERTLTLLPKRLLWQTLYFN